MLSSHQTTASWGGFVQEKKQIRDAACHTGLNLFPTPQCKWWSCAAPQLAPVTCTQSCAPPAVYGISSCWSTSDGLRRSTIYSSNHPSVFCNLNNAGFEPCQVSVVKGNMSTGEQTWSQHRSACSQPSGSLVSSNDVTTVSSTCWRESQLISV